MVCFCWVMFSATINTRLLKPEQSEQSLQVMSALWNLAAGYGGTARGLRYEGMLGGAASP